MVGQTCVSADPYTSAYGPQAIMSPATTSLSYSLPAQAQTNSAQPNGVYLTGQQQQASMPAAQPSTSAPYYAPPQMQMPAYSQGYYPQTMPLDPMTGYGANSYTAYKPIYGQSPQMVQRNSTNYGEANNFPYRKTPEVVLNPNSMTGYNPEAGKPQSSVMNILNGITQRPVNNGNWFQRVFQRGGTNTATSEQKPFAW